MKVERAYRISELAALYEVKPDLFKEWIKPILPELKAMGYNSSKHIHTVKECQHIVDFLGSPEQ